MGVGTDIYVSKKVANKLLNGYSWDDFLFLKDLCDRRWHYFQELVNEDDLYYRSRYTTKDFLRDFRVISTPSDDGDDVGDMYYKLDRQTRLRELCVDHPGMVFQSDSYDKKPKGYINIGNLWYSMREYLVKNYLGKKDWFGD